jgi:hypothetical protein
MLGVVELGDQAKVLLKNTPTGESRYFTQGETAFGFKVTAFKDNEVTLALGERIERVTMSNDIPIEGPGGASTAAASGFSQGGGRFGRGGFGGDRGRGGFGGFGGDRGRGGFGGFGGDRSRGGFGGERGERGDRREARGGESGGSGGGSGGGFNTAEIFSLTTWTERLKKLEEVKSQIEPAQYERLKAFMTERARGENR